MNEFKFRLTTSKVEHTGIGEKQYSFTFTLIHPSLKDNVVIERNYITTRTPSVEISKNIFSIEELDELFTPNEFLDHSPDGDFKCIICWTKYFIPIDHPFKNDRVWVCQHCLDNLKHINN